MSHRSLVRALIHHAAVAATLSIAALVVAPAALPAQVGSTTDIITGIVTTPDGKPYEGATVEATSIETQITRRTRSGSNGRYTIVFPDGGGAYTIRVRALGFAPQEFALARQADEDRLVRDVQISQTAVAIGGVTVRARRPRVDENLRPTPGATGRNVTGEQATRLPIDASDFNDLAALAPGVIPITGSDTTAAGFSVAGLPATQNNVTLDGLTFGGASVPQDAVRSTRVITNTYDVARGQFTGGLVATTTKGGTNVPSGSFSYALRDRDLAFGVDQSSPFARGFTQNQLGGGFGGPLIRDKLFAFGAVQGRRRTSAVTSLLQANAATLQRLGTSPDSVTGFLGAVQGFGLPMAPESFDPNQVADNASALLRIDYLFADNHTLTLRGDWRYTGQDPSRVGALSLPVTGGTQAGHGGGLMATLTSRFGTLINELRAYGSVDRRESDPFLAAPQGRVQVSSLLGDSARAIQTLVFGGNPGLPQASETRMFEGSDELSWLPGDASHRIKLGVLLNAQRFEQDATSNRGGTFTFHSLADLEANRPAQFTRTLAPSLRAGTALNPAVYLGDTWRRSAALQLNYGLRVEGSSFRGAPAYNALVDSTFGLRTDRFPSELHVSPRAGFTWTVGGGDGGAGGGRGGRRGGGGARGGGFGAFGGGPAPLIIRGGIGEFRSPAPTGLFAAAEGATGITGAEEQLVCVGDAAPVPDWGAYLSDPTSVPTTCVGGVVPAVITNARPSVTAFASDFGAPRAWRASLGLQRRFLERYGVSVDASFVRGVGMTGVRDVNLDATPRFTLANEGSRPVFVPASAIVPGTGTTQFFASRLDPAFGHVLALGSDLASRSEQLTFSVNGFTALGLLFQASYTWLHARDQSSFSCCSATQGLGQATTAANPNVREWAPSDNQRRHSFLLTATYPVTSTFELTAIGRVMSGTPFTPLVGSDINGDGLRNDRAFIFDPAATSDTAVSNAMRRVLGGASAASRQARECLSNALGSIATRNACEGPWRPSLDFQLNVRPTAWGLDRRLTLSVLTVNMLAGVDQLLHGSNGLRGWGMFSRPDETLLYVRGFDPATQQYRYQVNERFGATGGSALAFRNPFQIAFQLRYTLGPDQARDRLRGIFGAGGRRGGGGEGAAANASDFAERFARVLPNPITRIVEMKDTLQLTADQLARLTALRDTLDHRNSAVSDSIRAMIQAAGASPNPARLFADVRPKLQEGRANVQKALDEAEHVLSKEQWSKVPDDVKRPGAGRPSRQD